MALNSNNGAVTASRPGFKIRDGCSLARQRLLLEGVNEHQSVQVSVTFDPALPGLFVTSQAPFPLPNKGVLNSCSVAAASGDTALLLETGHPTVYVGELANGDHELLRPHPITSAEFGSYPHAWSANGESVLYEQYHEKWYLFQQRIDHHDPQPLVQPQIEGFGARLSPDNRWVLFFRNDSSGSPKLFRVSAQAQRGQPAQLAVPAGDVRCPRVGAECVLRTKDTVSHATGLYALDPATGAIRLLHSLPWEEASFTDWDVSPDGNSVVLCESVTTKGVLRIVNLRSKAYGDAPAEHRCGKLGRAFPQ